MNGSVEPCPIEGPSVLKKNGIYYLIYSANHFESKNYGVGYATSDSPVGPWTKYVGNPILQRVYELMGTGHGVPFPVSYTHLDVYKRQLFGRVAFVGREIHEEAELARQPETTCFLGTTRCV